MGLLKSTQTCSTCSEGAAWTQTSNRCATARCLILQRLGKNPVQSLPLASDLCLCLMSFAPEVDEFFHSYNIGYMIDLSVGLMVCKLLPFERVRRIPSCRFLPILINQGDGKTCLAAIKRRAAIVGVTFTDEHKEQLYRRLETQVFAEFQNPESSLFEPALVSILGSNKKRKGTGNVSCLINLQLC